MNMTNESKSVYSATAEVVGMTLKLLCDLEKGEKEAKWHEQYVDNITKMLFDRKLDHLITCIHRIQLHYPEISDRYAEMFTML